MPTCHSRADFEGQPFIYIHTPKTGGVSLTSALEGLADSYENDISLRNCILEYNHAMLGAYQGILFWHITMRDLMRHYGEEAIRRYYSFSFIRNPWDWLVSMYFFIRRTPEHPESMIAGHMDFRQFVLYWGSKGVQQVDFMRGHGVEPAVSRIYRFEDFPQAINDLAEECALHIGTLPMLNTAQNREEWRHYYDHALFHKVLKMLSDDVRIGEYEVEY